MEKIACRTPAPGKVGVTNIPKWKFELIRSHILDIVREAGTIGFPFSDLSPTIGTRLTDEETNQLGSVAWHVATVKLEMEVRGELRRTTGKGKQRLMLI